MTIFTSPPNQNFLALNNGDILKVGTNGVATEILVHAGGVVEIDGGTVVNTILAGGHEFVHSGVTNGIEFRPDSSDPHIAAVLSITDPNALQGTITFDRPPPEENFVNTAIIKFGGLGAGITGYSRAPGSFTVDFGEFDGHPAFSVKYTIQVLGGDDFAGFNIQLDAGDNEFLITVEHGASPNFSHEAAATIVYAAEFGSAPSASQLSGLTQFTQAQFAYGQKIGVDAGIYTFTALGVALASDGQQFQNKFGSTNSAYPNSTAGDAKFVTDAYVGVFGHAGSAAQVQHFVDQLNFYEGLYTAAGVFGDASNVDLLARGAVYGQMIGVVHETPVAGQPVSLVGVTPSVMDSVLV